MADRSHLWAPVASAGAAAVVVAAVGGSITDVGPWYQSLEKPGWTPPDWAFGPAWTLIFACAALSAAIAWRGAPTRSARENLVGLFCANGLLNILWSFLFFKLQRPDWALIEVAVLWLSVLVLMLFVGRWSRTSALLLAPYLVWVGFAAFLNFVIVALNAPFG